MSKWYTWFSLYFPAVLGFIGIAYAYSIFFNIVEPNPNAQALIVVVLGSLLVVVSVHRGAEYKNNEFMVTESFEPGPWVSALGLMLFMIAFQFNSVVAAVVGGVVLLVGVVFSVRSTGSGE